MNTRTLISIALALMIVGGLVAMALTGNGSTPSGEADPFDREMDRIAGALRGSFVKVDVEITLDLPRGMGPPEEFAGSGVVDFEHEEARVVYDLSELPNSAGFFGQLMEFPVIYEGSVAYIEIFSTPPEWVAFQPETVVGMDVDRLREAVLISPLVIPDLIDHGSFEQGGDPDTFAGALDLAGDQESRILDVWMNELGIEAIEASAMVVSDRLTELTYEVSFPVVPGAEDNLIWRVVASFTESSPERIQVPTSDRVRDVSEFGG